MKKEENRCKRMAKSWKRLEIEEINNKPNGKESINIC